MFNENITLKNPLYLPAGSVRALLALGLLCLFSVAAFNNSTLLSDIKDVLLIVIGFYFGSKK